MLGIQTGQTQYDRTLDQKKMSKKLMIAKMPTIIPPTNRSSPQMNSPSKINEPSMKMKPVNNSSTDSSNWSPPSSSSKFDSRIQSVAVPSGQTATMSVDS